MLSGVAALLGYPGTRSAIEATLASGSLKRTVRYLANRFLLLEHEGALDREYLQHAIVQAFYYDLLGRPERQALHRRAGEYYEREEPDALRAALHYQAAGEYSSAARIGDSRHLGVHQSGPDASPALAAHGARPTGPRSPMAGGGENRPGRSTGFLRRDTAGPGCFRGRAVSFARPLASPELADLEARACLGMGSLLANQTPAEALRWLDRGLAVVSPDNLLLRAALHNRRGTILVGQADYQAGHRCSAAGTVLCCRIRPASCAPAC